MPDVPPARDPEDGVVPTALRDGNPLPAGLPIGDEHERTLRT
jgi:hypothetical protein